MPRMTSHARAQTGPARFGGGTGDGGGVGGATEQQRTAALSNITEVDSSQSGSPSKAVATQPLQTMSLPQPGTSSPPKSILSRIYSEKMVVVSPGSAAPLEYISSEVESDASSIASPSQRSRSPSANGRQKQKQTSRTVSQHLSQPVAITTPILDASEKRNAEFHQLFRSVPEEDPLIDDYSAALQRDILIHGRVYVAREHICFHASILGWITNV